MKYVIIFYIATMLVWALAVFVTYLIKPDSYKGCDFRLLPNIIALLTWPIIFIKSIKDGDYKK